MDILTKNRQKSIFGWNIIETCDFHKIFAYILSKNFVDRQNKNHGVSPTPTPSTDNFDDSPSWYPPVLIHFYEKMRYRVSIDYIQPFGNLRLPKKVVWEKSQAVSTAPLGGWGLNTIWEKTLFLFTMLWKSKIDLTNMSICLVMFKIKHHVQVILKLLTYIEIIT